jgi:glutaredoxin-like YruB-family protein
MWTASGGHNQIWMGMLLLGIGLAGCEQIEDWFADEPPAGPADRAVQPSEPGPAQAGQPTQPADPADLSRIAPAGPMLGVYKFEDDRGVIHYVDSLAKVPARYRKKAHHPQGGSYTIVEATPIDELLEKNKIDPRRYQTKGGKPTKVQQRKHDRVILYTTSWCGYCTRARQFLESRQVAFVEKNVERDRAALEEMLTKSGGARGVPVIDVYGTVLRGFSAAQVDQALGR